MGLVGMGRGDTLLSFYILVCFVMFPGHVDFFLWLYACCETLGCIILWQCWDRMNGGRPGTPGVWSAHLNLVCGDGRRGSRGLSL